MCSGAIWYTVCIREQPAVAQNFRKKAADNRENQPLGHSTEGMSMSVIPAWERRIRVELTSAAMDLLIDRITKSKIPLLDVEYVDHLRITCTVSALSFPRLCDLVEQQGSRIRALQKIGMVHILCNLWHRPVLLLGLIGLLILSCWLPTRVLFVQVKGNETIPTGLILEQAQQCGIQFGASRRDVRSEKMKNKLMESVPELKWAGINTYGCTAVISVREKTKVDTTAESGQLKSVVSLCDAIIRDITVHKGNALCKVGQAVRTGQLLVSPYNDCGIFTQVTGAKAEIWGDTQRPITVIVPSECTYRTEILTSNKKYSLILGKKRINFYKGSGICGTTCAKIYEEKYIKLPGGFVLPIGIICEQTVTYDQMPTATEPVEGQLLQCGQHYLKTILPTCNILQTDYVCFQAEGFARIECIFHCYELIGVLRPEEAEK